MYVFPVPGGPWITANSLVSATCRALNWESSRPKSCAEGQEARFRRGVKELQNKNAVGHVHFTWFRPSSNNKNIQYHCYLRMSTSWSTLLKKLLETCQNVAHKSLKKVASFNESCPFLSNFLLDKCHASYPLKVLQLSKHFLMQL